LYAVLPDNASVVPSPIAQRLRALRKRAGRGVRELAQLLGKPEQPNSYQYYERTFKKPTLPREFVDKIRPFFVGRGEPPITDGELDDLAGIPATPVAIEMKKPDDTERPRVVLYLSSVIPGDSFGAHVLINERIGDVPRPDNISQYIEKAFSYRLLDGRNAPRFKNREIIVIDPTFEGVEGDDCVFMAEFDGAPRTVVVVGNLVRSTPNLWIITQYSAPTVEVEIPKSQYPKAWPIRGHHFSQTAI
jgi:hypothetical protein